jgi:hypothetical protein
VRGHQQGDHGHPGRRWIRIAEDNAAFGQTVAAADDILQNQTETFKAGDYLPSRSTRRAASGSEDRELLRLLRVLPPTALRHRRGAAGHPEPERARPRAAARAGRPVEAPDVRADGARPRHAPPARRLADGRRGLLFALCCYTLHRRERTLRTNLAEAASGGAVVPVGAAD